MLLDFGADPKALDASRVLRLVDTTSSRTDEWIRVVHTARTPTMGGALMTNGVVGYDFDVFADTVLPVVRVDLEEQQAQRERNRRQDALEKAAREATRSNLVVVKGGVAANADKPSGLRAFIPSELAWARLEDLRTLASLRGHEDGLPPGQRDTFVFLSACFLAQARLVRDLKSEVIELAGQFAPTWSESDTRSCAGSAVARAEQASRGEKVVFQGLELDPRYRWRNETLVDRLGITTAEARELKTILPADEAKRRDAQRQEDRRRAAGAVSRAAYLGQATARRQQALQLQTAGLSQRAIARELGVSPATICAYLKG
jgi:DNA-binding CsgD family transcriptional regulator